MSVTFHVIEVCGIYVKSFYFNIEFEAILMHLLPQGVGDGLNLDL